MGPKAGLCTKVEFLCFVPIVGKQGWGQISVPQLSLRMDSNVGSRVSVPDWIVSKLGLQVGYQRLVARLGLKECHSKIAFRVPIINCYLSQLLSPDKGLVLIVL